MERFEYNDYQIDSLSKKLGLHLSSDETSLFTLKRNKFEIFSRGHEDIFLLIAPIFLLLISIFALFFVLLIQNLEINGIFFLSVSGLILIFVVIAYLMIKKSWLRTETQLIITNQNLYLYKKAGLKSSLESSALSDLLAVIFRKGSFWNRKKDTSSIDFILKDEYLKKIGIDNIPNFHIIQNIIESILYVYGDIEERWKKIQNKVNFKFPHAFRISQKELKEISKRKKLLKIGTVLSFIPLIIGFVLLFVLQEIISKIPLFIMFSLMSIGIQNVFNREKSIYRALNPSFTLKLILNINQITLSNEISQLVPGRGILRTLAFTKTTALNFWEAYKASRKWNTDILGIIIKDSYKSKRRIDFGPVDDFPDFFEIFFCYIIIWKAERGMLLSEEKIRQLGFGFLEEFEEKNRKITIPEPTFTQKKEILIEALPISDESYQYFRKYLETDEKILQIFIPVIKFTVNIWLLCIGILLIILSIVIIMVLASIYLMLLLPLSFGFLMYHMIHIFYKLPHRGSMFVLTCKKIILAYPKNCFLIDYADIISISHRDKKNTYDIELNLKTPIKDYPLHPKTKIIIPLIPNENTFIEILNFLRTHFLHEFHPFENNT